MPDPDTEHKADMDGEPKLKFVLLCNALELEQWQADCVCECLESGHAELALIVVNDPPPKAEKSGFAARLRRIFGNSLLLWRLFNRLYVSRSSRAVRPQEMGGYFGGIDVINERPVKAGRFGETFTPETIARIKDAAPDFVLRFGFGIIKGEILSIGKYGVWSYHHGDPSAFRGQPPGFWEIFHGAPVTGSILQVLSEELDAGKILHRGYFQTISHSYAKTRDLIYSGSSPWVRRTCAAIRANGWPLAPDGDDDVGGGIYRQPGNLEMLKFLGVTVRNFLATQVRYKLFRQKWNVAVVPGDIATVSGLRGADAQAVALAKAQWMPDRRTEFLADPFGMAKAGAGIRIFFERFRNADRVATIAARDYADGKFGPIEPVLNTSTHLSYPFVWQGEGGSYIVPEHSEARNVSAFPVAADGPASDGIALFENMEMIDTTLVEWNDRLWAFALINGAAQNSELHIFHADGPKGPWRPHLLNPVKTDVTNARPAGTFFRRDGKLFRPAQDCSLHYGCAVTVNEIVELSETAFAEQPVARVAPGKGDRYNYGLHTLSEVEDVTLIDGALKEFAWNPMRFFGG